MQSEPVLKEHSAPVPTSHAAWDVGAVRGVHAMYSVSNLGTACRRWDSGPVGQSLTRSKAAGGGCHDEFMTGDHRDDSCAAHEAVAEARREAARAQARLAGAAVRYADARIAEETARIRNLWFAANPAGQAG
jgi:hypothetical protein